MHPEVAGLPEGTQLRIIDLPGLKHIADERNKEVIRNEIRPALCLVTYDSTETDPVKQQMLLDAVVGEVRELRGSPARMLFILNRIDVFRHDPDWQERMGQFCDKTMHKVRESIAKALPEYGDQAAKLCGQRLSTGPALYACQALTGPHEQAINALEKVNMLFRFLMPEEVYDLPVRIKNWSNHDCKMIAQSVWRASYAADLDDSLRLHIQDNLPQLLLPHLLKALTDIAGECLTSVDQIAHAHVHASGKKYEKKCASLAEINNRLQQCRDSSRQKLLEMIALSNEDDIIGELTDKANILQKHYELAKDSLVPLYDWSLQIGNTVEMFLTSIHEAIGAQETYPKGYLFESLGRKQQAQIVELLKELGESGYRTYTIEGGYLDAKTADQKGKLRAMNQALNNLATVLAATMQRVVDRTAEREAERIQDALQALLGGYANVLTNDAQEIAPDLAGLSVTPSSVVRVKQKLVFNFVFHAGFPIYPGTERVHTGRYKEVKTGEKRIWYTLWLKKRDIYESQPIYEMRSYEQAVIPGITEVFTDFIGQAKASRPEGAFTRWLQSQIERFLSDVEDYQENLLKEYRERLDQVRKLAKDVTDKETAIWEDASSNIICLRDNLIQMAEVS